MPSHDPIRLVVLDARPVMRAGIVACLSDQPDFEITGDFDVLRFGLDHCAPGQADVVVLGYQHRTSVTEAIDALSRVDDELRFLVLAHCGGDARARRAIDAGAHGFVRAGIGPDDMARAVRAVASGQRFLDNASAIDMANHSADEELQPKEIDVLRQTASGRSNKRIAVELSMTEAAVKSHIRRILAKLGAADRTHAVVIAARRGFIDVHP